MDDDGQLQGRKPGAVVGAQYCLQTAEQFTLKNAVFSKDWSITNANGQEIFQVRGKLMELTPKRELVDMGGNTVVILKEKHWSWVSTWGAFHPGNPKQTLWTIRKPVSFSIGPRLQIFLPSNTERDVPDYTIKGNWLCKKCTVFFGEQTVAEVERDTSLKNMLASRSIFHVLVQPGVDTAFIFSLIVIMDKLYIHGDGGVSDNGGG